MTPETVVCPTHGIEAAELDRESGKSIPELPQGTEAIQVRAVLACGYEMTVVTLPRPRFNWEIDA